MRVLITGGCKNGKSSLAQRICTAQGDRHVYVATMVPRDDEDLDCIRRHREDREGMGFETCEIARNLASLRDVYPAGSSLMVDSVTALLAEEMFQGGGFDESAVSRTAEDLTALCAAFKNIVFVSDSILSDARRYDAMTETYRAGLAALERTLCSCCDTVVEQCFGRPVIHKGSLPAACIQSKKEKKDMTLVIGGAHQGKYAFAHETLGLPEEKIFRHAELKILEMLDAGIDPVAEMEALAAQWEGGAILLEDVCCGVVPMDARERAWRIAVGRCGTALSARASHVYRVFCGKGMELLDA